MAFQVSSRGNPVGIRGLISPPFGVQSSSSTVSRPSHRIFREWLTADIPYVPDDPKGRGFFGLQKYGIVLRPAWIRKINSARRYPHVSAKT